ncbi:tRNA (adenosine(37)-N6)-threonylcarbamoyltransferase complex dimerization subunit type 1 TsaB [Candidatus Saccharibacteria bacterium 32-49-10]|nr:MAG: tRNA (adenosine(37)-N6)-threonylcarbamoyltransferase complex dimerization subunit type 1 TsaB [Candidatus Saccharibacteria bacterium 32-49-10]
MKYLLIDTSTPAFKMTLVNGTEHIEHMWDAGRTLAKNILGYIDEGLSSAGLTYDDIDGLGVFRGPGSFTGLRIGLTVANTIASAQSLPIVGATGDEWQQQSIDRLSRGESDTIVLPEYGSGARITKPRK